MSGTYESHPPALCSEIRLTPISPEVYAVKFVVALCLEHNLEGALSSWSLLESALRAPARVHTHLFDYICFHVSERPRTKLTCSLW